MRNKVIKRGAPLVAANVGTLLVAVVLVQRHFINPYPGAILIIVGVIAFDVLVLSLLPARIFLGDDRTQVDAFARRGTTRMIWAFVLAGVIAIVVALLTKDFRYIVQAIIVLAVVGYVYFILRQLRRKADGNHESR